MADCAISDAVAQSKIKWRSLLALADGTSDSRSAGGFLKFKPAEPEFGVAIYLLPAGVAAAIHKFQSSATPGLER